MGRIPCCQKDNVKRGQWTPEEDNKLSSYIAQRGGIGASSPRMQMIVKLHAVLGNRWSVIAAQLPGRTDNDVKNYWNTKQKKKLSGMGIDPVTHKPFSHLMAEIATALPLPHMAHLAEAALGCCKDEMLHLLTKKHIDFGVGLPSTAPANPDTSADKNRVGLTRAAQEPEFMAATDFLGTCGGYPLHVFRFGRGSGFGDDVLLFPDPTLAGVTSTVRLWCR